MKKLACLSSSLVLLSCAVFAADERSQTDAPPREQTKRVVVWPHGPKAQPTISQHPSQESNPS